MLPYPDIDPVAIAVGPVKLRWYGLMYLIGFVVAWGLGRWRARRPDNPFTVTMIDDLLAWCILGLVIGARVGYVLFYNIPYFIENPLSALMIWQGGMSFHGGLLGLIFCFWLFARKHGLSIFQVADFVSPLAPPGLMAGRLGNFINAELWGRHTDMPWGMIFPGAGGAPRHPSQLYEAFLEGLVLFTLMWLATSKPRPIMTSSGLFLSLYGVFRFSVEFVRQPDNQLGFIALDWMTMGQLLCLPMILFGLFLLWRANWGRFPDPA